MNIVPFERTLTLHHEDAKYMYAFQLFFRQAGAGTDRPRIRLTPLPTRRYYPCPSSAVGSPRQPQMRREDSEPSGRVHLRCGESHVEDGRRPSKLPDRLLVERGYVRADDDTR